MAAAATPKGSRRVPHMWVATTKTTCNTHKHSTHTLHLSVSIHTFGAHCAAPATTTSSRTSAARKDKTQQRHHLVAACCSSLLTLHCMLSPVTMLCNKIQLYQVAPAASWLLSTQCKPFFCWTRKKLPPIASCIQSSYLFLFSPQAKI